MIHTAKFYHHATQNITTTPQAIAFSLTGFNTSNIIEKIGATSFHFTKDCRILLNFVCGTTSVPATPTGFIFWIQDSALDIQRINYKTLTMGAGIFTTPILRSIMRVSPSVNYAIYGQTYSGNKVVLSDIRRKYLEITILQLV